MELVLIILAVYLVVGLVFGVAFVLVGAARIDPAAARGPVRVRLVFLPGAAALWPVLAVRWMRAGESGVGK